MANSNPRKYTFNAASQRRTQFVIPAPGTDIRTKENNYPSCQLLHLSARTRCRWSLRFQVSYLTLLLRRTNRSGPVDSLPRIFAEVAAHRHKVMPQGDRFRSIQISIDPIAAIAAMEIRLVWTDTQMQTSRTGLRCIPR